MWLLPFWELTNVHAGHVNAHSWADEAREFGVMRKVSSGIRWLWRWDLLIDWLIDWVVDMRVDVISAPEVYVKHAMHQLYVNLCHRTVWYEFNWSDQESEWHEGDMMKKIDVSEEEMCWFLWIQSETWLVILTLCEIMCDKQCSEKIKRNAW